MSPPPFRERTLNPDHYLEQSEEFREPLLQRTVSVQRRAPNPPPSKNALKFPPRRVPRVSRGLPLRCLGRPLSKLPCRCRRSSGTTVSDDEDDNVDEPSAMGPLLCIWHELTADFSPVIREASLVLLLFPTALRCTRPANVRIRNECCGWGGFCWASSDDCFASCRFDRGRASGVFRDLFRQRWTLNF